MARIVFKLTSLLTSRANKTHCFLLPDINYFVIAPNSEIEKKKKEKLRRNRLFDADWVTNLKRLNSRKKK